MRWKLTLVESDMYTCCWCCHVRTGTVFFGILALLLQISAILLIGVLTMRPDMSSVFEDEPYTFKSPQKIPDLFDTETPKPDNARLWWRSRKNWTDDDKFVATVFAIGCVTSTMLLIYGAVKGKPSHMVPFMGLQVFDFCMTSLIVISYFSYVPDVKRWIEAQQASFPMKERLMSVEADWLMLAIVMTSVAVLVIKAYLIGIVWSCYKYLCQQQQLRQTFRTCRNHDSTSDNPEDAEMLLPPKYEDVILLPASNDPSQPPPPPYAG